MRLLINRDFTPDLLERIRAIVPDVEILTHDDLVANPSVLATVDVVYGFLAPERWTEAQRLRWVQITSAGVEGLLKPPVLAHPAMLTNARIHGIPIAEHLFGMLLMLTRGLQIAYTLQLAQTWDSREPRAQVETLPGKTLGILGLGAIGSRVAEIGAAFGLRLLGLRRHPCVVPGIERVYTPDEKREMLAQCDFVMNTLPLTAETRGFIGREELAVMKPTALLFNIGRGATIDTDALVEALTNGTIRGGGFDVTDPEPLPADHPLWGMPNVIITPHYAGSHPDYNRNADAIFLENLRRSVAGEPLRDVVDKAAGY